MEDFEILLQKAEAASLLSKQATSAANLNESIILLREAIKEHDYMPYYIKLSNYLLKNNELDLAIQVLIEKLNDYKGMAFDSEYDLKEMSISVLYSHLATQFNKLNRLNDSIVYSIVSVIYYSIGLAIQGRKSELQELIKQKSKSEHFGPTKFWSKVKKSNVEELKVKTVIDFTFSSISEPLLATIARVDVFSKIRPIPDYQILLNDKMFWDNYKYLVSREYEGVLYEVLKG